MPNPLRRLSRKPKWHAGAQWRWQFEGVGYVWLPNSSSDAKVLRIEDQDTFDTMVGMLTKLNAPSRWQRLKERFAKDTKKPKPAKFLTALDLAVGEYEASHQPPTVLLRRQARGKVIKQTRHAEFNPGAPRTGGRVVKVMPRQLQRIKQAQEKFEKDSDAPSVEDIED